MTTIAEAFAATLSDTGAYPTSFTIDCRDRAGDPVSAHYSGVDALRRAESWLDVLRGRHSTGIIVTGRWADGATRTVTVEG